MTKLSISAALLVLSAVVAIVLERVRPYRRFEIPAKVVFSDFLHWFMRVMTRGFDAFIASVATAVLGRFAGGAGWIGPAAKWPFWVQLVAVFLLLDLVHWLVHFAHHRVPFLWKVHAVHHSPENLYWLAAFRRHFVQELLFDAAKVFAVVLMGFDSTAAFIYFASRVVWSIPAHANIRLPAGWLNYVVITWESHRWHHSSDPAIRDKNMSLHFPFWDMVFGTFYCPPGKEPEALGVSDYPNFPTNFFVQQLVPFFYDEWAARETANKAAPEQSQEGTAHVG